MTNPILKKTQTFFDKNNIKQTLLNAAFILFLLSLLYRFTKEIFSTYSYESWQISEYLINYQGGFVRRGLTGEILFFFAKNFNINIEWTIKIFCLICFVAVCIFFVRAFLKKGYSLYILPLCFFLGMGILSNCWVRKDYLFLCFFIPILWIYGKENLSMIIKFLFINILAIFIILSHEVFAFFALPVLFLLLFNQYKNKGILKSVSVSFLFLFPSIFAFLLTLLYHGNQETAQAIWNSWHIIANQTSSEVDHWNAAAISSLGWTSKWAFEFHFTGNFLAVNKRILSLLIWAITFPVVYYISTNALFAFRKNKTILTNKHKTILSSILIFQLLCLSPVFSLLSWDWIRLFFYWIASSFAIFLIVPTDKIEKLIPSFFAKFINCLNNCLSNILFPRKTTLVLLMLFIGISNYTFILDSAIYNTMIYNILSFSSTILIKLKIKGILMTLFDFFLNLF